MAKKKKKERHEDCGHEVDSINNVHNIKTNVHLFINAIDLEDAMTQFDLCDFAFRKEWKVFLETGHQPS